MLSLGYTGDKKRVKRLRRRTIKPKPGLLCLVGAKEINLGVVGGKKGNKPLRRPSPGFDGLAGTGSSDNGAIGGLVGAKEINLGVVGGEEESNSSGASVLASSALPGQ